jgi:murein DD-endopeptidase MepM/ murein hydrolase activator NlpD
MPIAGAPSDGGEREVVTKSEDGASPVLPLPPLSLGETPQAASTSISLLPGKHSGAQKRSPRRAALAIAGSAAAILSVAVVPLVALKGSASTAAPAVSAASVAASIAELEIVVDGAAVETATAPAAPAPTPPKTWRVNDMADGDVSVVDVAVGRKGLLAALASVQIPPAEALRVSRSLASVRRVDRLQPQDALILAFDKSAHRVVAYELKSSPSDVWQAREQPDADGAPALQVRKLDLLVSKVRVGKSVLVGSDLRTSLSESGMTPVDEVLALLDDALEAHVELSDVRPGARLRFLGTQEQIEGAFVRWVSLDAVEYFPASPNATPVRVYSFAAGGEEDSKYRHGDWFDAKGRQPVRGGLRMPVLFTRIASRFNPRRMHPILHVIVPHNGVDFAAPVGTPVYATAAGAVTSVGNGGPCGNMVEIAHAGGITSVYCHLSRFAAGLRPGMKVEQRQLIAYVGQTGRATGPHLHFGIRRNGVFVDPMTLRLDGMRVLPKSFRDDFDHRRAELDTELDSIALPASQGGAVEVGEPDAIFEEP